MQTLKSKKIIKIVLGVILTFVVSNVYLKYNNPCTKYIGNMPCDYPYGFPIRMWLITDYLELSMLIKFFIGVIANTTIWYLIVSALQHLWILVKTKRSR